MGRLARSAGTVSAAAPRIDTAAARVNGVSSGFTSMTTPPRARVRNGSDAAGCTSALVPTTRHTSVAGKPTKS